MVPTIQELFVSWGKSSWATMQGCAECALHIFIIIIDNMFSMTIFQQMADKHLKEQAAFYNCTKEPFGPSENMDKRLVILVKY